MQRYRSWQMTNVTRMQQAEKRRKKRRRITIVVIAVIICINLVIGLATPPFGITLFITSPMAGVKLEETVKEAVPLLIVTIAVLLLATFVPDFCLFLPRLLGYA